MEYGKYGNLINFSEKNQIFNLNHDLINNFKDNYIKICNDIDNNNNYNNDTNKNELINLNLKYLNINDDDKDILLSVIVITGLSFKLILSSIYV